MTRAPGGILFWLGTRWGLAGVALGWIVGYPILVVTMMLRWAIQYTGLEIRAYLIALFPAASSTAVMALAIVGVNSWLGGVSPVLRLTSMVAVGVAAYLRMMLLFHRERLRGFVSLMRG